MNLSNIICNKALLNSHITSWKKRDNFMSIVNQPVMPTWRESQKHYMHSVSDQCLCFQCHNSFVRTQLHKPHKGRLSTRHAIRPGDTEVLLIHDAVLYEIVYSWNVWCAQVPIIALNLLLLDTLLWLRTEDSSRLEYSILFLESGLDVLL